MESQMGKKTEHEMKTVVIHGIIYRLKGFERS